VLNFFLETFRLGLKNLRLHKLRSALTALGIIFGVAAVIAMVAIGEGGKKDAMERMALLGATNVVVRSTPPPESNEASSKTQRILEYGLKSDDLMRLKTMPGTKRVVPLRNTEQKVVFGGKRATANAVGTSPEWFEVINLQLERGQLFNQTNYDGSDAVAVIGAGVAAQLFPYQNPLGQTLIIGTSGMSTTAVTIVGVLEPTGLRAGMDGAGITDRDIDQDVYFPLTLAQDVFGSTIVKRQSGSMERKQIELSEVWLQMERIEDVERLSKVAENVVGIPTRRDVTVKAAIQILRNAERLSRIFNFIMVGIASFSLIVGGIGIMNIMLATVTERTKEIGIRRALGAKRRHITLQFLIETTVISLSGGAIGVAIGSGFAKALPSVVHLFSDQNYPTAIATWSVVGSFVVSGLIGVGFGLYPAIMAARMNPIEALRHE
jgi:putative ABC transport system permease protein